MFFFYFMNLKRILRYFLKLFDRKYVLNNDKIDMCLTNTKLILSIKCIEGLDIFILILFKI